MKDDLISRQAALDEIRECFSMGGCHADQYSIVGHINSLPSAQPEPLTEAEVIICKLYLDDLDKYKTCNEYKLLMGLLDGKASVQQNIIHCNECEYGSQDKYGRWFCRSLGCQIGEEDGSGYCADAERRTDAD